MLGQSLKSIKLLCLDLVLQVFSVSNPVIKYIQETKSIVVEPQDSFFCLYYIYLKYLPGHSNTSYLSLRFKDLIIVRRIQEAMFLKKNNIHCSLNQ